jgi:hypothetical protein
VRVCKPNPQVLLHASQEPVVHKYAVQLEGIRDNSGLPTAPLSTSVGAAGTDAITIGVGGDDVVNRGGDDGAEGFEDGRVGGVGDGGVVGAGDVRTGGGGAMWHKLQVCLQLALHNIKGKSVSATSAAECGSMLYCDVTSGRMCVLNCKDAKSNQPLPEVVTNATWCCAVMI